MAKVRLLFVDDGEYHRESVEIPATSLAEYDRLIDCIRESAEVQARLYVDVDRLVAAYLDED